jgi:hypothetical protein
MLLKDLTYVPRDAVNDKQFCKELLDLVASDPAAYIRMTNLLLQTKEGSQLWVAKDVSDDLQAADIDPSEIKFEELDWPAERLEVYFEDVAIPTFLAVKTIDAKTAASVFALTGQPTIVQSTCEKMSEGYIMLQAEDEENSMLSFTYTAEDADRFAAGEDLEYATHATAITEALNDDETASLRQLALLLFKILLLASSEGHTVRRTRDKPTRKQGGKPGFKNRPVTDRLIVEYLPRHKVERAQAETAALGKTHKFLGRRGHWRRFHSEKFVNMQGRKKFIYPIPGPDGKVPRKKFVVRKPPLTQDACHGINLAQD